MFCIKCGAQNPDDSNFCHQCGRRLFKPETNPSETVVVASAQPVTHAPSTPPTEPGGEPATKAAGNKWTTAYGWLFVVAGLYSLVAGLITVLTPTGSVNPFDRMWEGKREAERLGISPVELERRREEKEELVRWAPVFQGLLFGVTGLAILRMSDVAVTLVWVTVVLSGWGVVFRGVTPLDLLLWAAWLGIAILYTKKRKLI